MKFDFFRESEHIFRDLFLRKKFLGSSNKFVTNEGIWVRTGRIIPIRSNTVSGKKSVQTPFFGLDPHPILPVSEKSYGLWVKIWEEQYMICIRIL